jgi:hypothetical protein
MISIRADETMPVPRPIVIELQCDTPACGRVEAFVCGFISAHSAAMAKGWLERQAPQGRFWLCPVCSGKRVA